MTLTNSTKIATASVQAEVPEAAAVEAGATGSEAFTLTSADYDDQIDLVYSATAEDAGTAGVVDGQPGLIYGGPGTGVRVAWANIDLLEAAITGPEAADTAVVALFVNSTVVHYSDEGVNTFAAEIAVEFNGDTYVSLAEGDVLRLGIETTGEVGEVNYDLAPGELMIV